VAPPFRWFDTLCDAGWPAALTPAALRVLLHVARRADRRTLETRAALGRLQAETKLPRRTFFLAKHELHHRGLVERIKIKGRRTATLRLVDPIPEVPPAAPASATHRTSRCNPLHFQVQPIALGNGQKPPRTRKTAAVHKQTKALIEEQTQAQELPALRDYLQGQGVPAAFLGSFLEAVDTVRAFPVGAVRSAAIEDAARVLSRRLQADGRPEWFELRVAEVLAAAVAIAHPTVQAAVRVFGVEVREVVHAS
jgi:hypothetical protein